MKGVAATSRADPNSVEAVAAVKQLVLSQIDKKLKDLRDAELMLEYLILLTYCNRHWFMKIFSPKVLLFKYYVKCTFDSC